MPYIPKDFRERLDEKAKELADIIAEGGAFYKYDGAFLGLMNFALTRLVQHLPRSLQAFCGFKDETRYWIQAGMFGVLTDVMLEYKVRVNQAYEIAQIEKSGDCYDTPYYSRVIEFLDETGKCVGKGYVNMPRTDATLHVDKLPFAIPVRTLVHVAKEGKNDA